MGQGPDSGPDGADGSDAGGDTGPGDGDLDVGDADGPVGDGDVDVAGGDGGGDEDTSCGKLTTFETGLEPTSEIHVAEDGSDQDGDGSVNRPFGTIHHAVSTAQPGTAVRIHSGTYPGGVFLEAVHGQSGAPIWIGGAPGEARPVIEGGSEAIHLIQARYLVLHDLETHGSNNNGINADDGGELADPDATRFIVFRNLYVHDVGGTGNQDCLKLSGLDDYWVLDSQFARCGGGSSGSGIDHVGCHRGLIQGCRFEDNSGNAIQCKGGSEDIDIRGNWMVEPGERGINMGGSTGFQYFRPPLAADQSNAEARRIRVQANVIIGGTASLAFVGCVDCLAAHNTIVDPHNWIIRILQETTTGQGYEFEACANNRLVNNLIWYDRSDLSTWVNVGPNTAPESFVFSHNLWYAHDNPDDSTPDLPVQETAPIHGQDPALADPGGRNFHIGPGSVAAGSGLDDPDLVDADLDGLCYQDPPSRGAFAVP